MSTPFRRVLVVSVKQAVVCLWNNSRMFPVWWQLDPWPDKALFGWEVEAVLAIYLKLRDKF